MRQNSLINIKEKRRTIKNGHPEKQPILGTQDIGPIKQNKDHNKDNTKRTSKTDPTQKLVEGGGGVIPGPRIYNKLDSTSN